MAPKQSKLKVIKIEQITKDAKPETKAQKLEREAEEAKLLKDAADQTRLSQANMVTSLKKKTDERSKAFMQEYCSLGRFDQQKDCLLEAWQNDKTLKQWYNNYKETKTKSYQVSQEGVLGYGTQYPPVLLFVWSSTRNPNPHALNTKHHNSTFHGGK